MITEPLSPDELRELAGRNPMRMRQVQAEKDENER